MAKAKYSFLSLFRHGLQGHKNWPQAWRSPDPKPHYDVVIIGGGGHGLATAYYLAKRHGIKNVAVVEAGWLGGGNTGRNTTVIRSNYFYPESTRFFDHSLCLYEGLSSELNYNLMLSQGGILTLAHSRHELEMMTRWANSMQVQAVDSQMLTPDQIKAYSPLINTSPDARFPIWGGFVQHRGGVARHDAVAWGFARSADELGVDIIQSCPVTDMIVDGGRITGVETARGVIKADKVAMCVAGHTSVIGAMAGLSLPIVSQPLQAMVSEPVKPCLNGVVLSPPLQTYVSQSDRGEILIGGAADKYPSYGQRGNLPVVEDTLAATLALYPSFSRLKLMRQWAGIVDISPDSSPIIGKTPVTGLYISGGWGTGGFKAIPAGGDTLAYTIAHDRPHELIEPFGLDRFARGAFIDEGAAAGVAH
ncbi:MAG: sarcosine oxidase subunit beta family protein [Alphaproteobacteria bacterium]